MNYSDLVFFYDPVLSKVTGVNRIIGVGRFMVLRADVGMGTFKVSGILPMSHLQEGVLERVQFMVGRTRLGKVVAEYEDIDFDKHVQFWFPTETPPEFANRQWGAVDAHIFVAPDNQMSYTYDEIVEKDNAWVANLFAQSDMSYPPLGADAVAGSLAIVTRRRPLDKMFFSTDGTIYRAGYWDRGNRIVLSRVTFWDSKL